MLLDFHGIARNVVAFVKSFYEHSDAFFRVASNCNILI